jgi:hypothetical protein
MPGNPLVPQGVLNRVLGSIYWDLQPSLNVTAPYLGKGGISISFDGDATTFINTMTGQVQSPEPYQPILVTMNLLKTQNLAALYEAQRRKNTYIGDGQVYPDVSQTSGGIPIYPINNCAIRNIRELDFRGEDAGYVVTMGGYYLINSDMFNAG